jgi:branched-chain amino acid transport system ATP-binding protein
MSSHGRPRGECRTREPRGPTSEPVLAIEGLSAGYGGMPVLRGIDLAVERGEIVALVGSNGAGKTTLLRALARVVDSSGVVRFAGRDTARLTPEAMFDLGLVHVPEGRQLFDGMTVEENLLMGAYRRRERGAVRASLAEAYRLFPPLGERRTQRAGSLSGGEQQMCALARALMAEPTLLAVDEMSLGLAPVVVDQLLELLATIPARGVTVLLVEQDVYSALKIADRAYVLETGRIVRAGTSRELLRDPEVQRAYLGL